MEKFRNTRQRAAKRREVAYMYRNELRADLSRKQVLAFVDTTIRKKLSYSPKTGSYDIYISLLRTLKNLQQ